MKAYKNVFTWRNSAGLSLKLESSFDSLHRTPSATESLAAGAAEGRCREASIVGGSAPRVRECCEALASRPFQGRPPASKVGPTGRLAGRTV